MKAFKASPFNVIMKKINYIYAILSTAALLFSGCSASSDPDNASNGDSEVYLSVTRAAYVDGTESINTDNIDYEDRVHDLAMLVFDSGTGEKVAEYYESGIAMSGSNTFVVKLTPGQRDFFFVANMPAMTNALQAITNKSDLIDSMAVLRNLDPALYLGASSDNGFPMSRVYINQTVTKEGNIYQPAPFLPDGENKVKLIRVVAKLEVDIAKSALGGTLGVKNIYFHNANRQYCLANPSVTIPSLYFTDGMPLKKANDSTYVCYMPESIISTATWGVSGDRKPINYFTIETTEGKTYDIPIISNETNVTTDYLNKATGNYAGFTPDYNIWRNYHYKFTVNNLQKIEILYHVNDWNTVNKSLYMGYGYNVEVDGTTVSIRNTVQACPPFSVTLKTLNGITFNDGTTQQTFTDVSSTASAAYNLNTTPLSGDYLQVIYNGTVLKTFTK